MILGDFIASRNWTEENYDTKGRVSLAYKMKCVKGKTVIFLKVASVDISQLPLDVEELMRYLGWIHKDKIPKSTLEKIRKRALSKKKGTRRRK